PAADIAATWSGRTSAVGVPATAPKSVAKNATCANAYNESVDSRVGNCNFGNGVPCNRADTCSTSADLHPGPSSTAISADAFTTAAASSEVPVVRWRTMLGVGSEKSARCLAARFEATGNTLGALSKHLCAP